MNNKKWIDSNGVFYKQGSSVVVGEQRYFAPLSEEILIAAGYTEYVAPEPAQPTEEELLQRAKQEKIMLIEEYDRSDNVNSFTINGISMWLDFDERARIRTSLEAYKATGQTEMSKWFTGLKFTFSLTLWELMLNILEIYAAEALNVTEQHKAMIELANNIEAVNNYDYTTDYPVKLNF